MPAAKVTTVFYSPKPDLLTWNVSCYMFKISRVIVTSVMAVAVLAPIGCGGGKGSKIQFTGKLILPTGATIEKDDIAEVNFAPEEANGVAAEAKVSTDQSFTLKSALDRKSGPMPGKYKVTVQIIPYDKNADPKDKAKQDRLNQLKTLNEKYNVKNSPLTYTITSDNAQSVTIDLVKGTISK